MSAPRLRWAPVAAWALTAACSGQDLQVFPAEYTDTWTQATVREVDVLLVVDSSGSMGGEQDKLAVEFDSFIRAFLDGEVDYHIGVVTTDVADATEAGLLRSGTVITPETEDAEEVFDKLVRVGTVGSGLEMGLEAARTALSEPLLSGRNAGFYRPDAALALVIFSDEDDLSPLSVDTYLNAFAELKGGDVYRNPDRLTISAVVGDAPFGCEAVEGEDVSIAEPGFRYIDAAQRTDGVFQSICADDYAPVVQALALDISGLKQQFGLTYCARENTLDVTVAGASKTQGVDYTYLPGERAIRFEDDAIPPANAEVVIAYEFLPDTRFTCPEG